MPTVEPRAGCGVFRELPGMLRIEAQKELVPRDTLIAAGARRSDGRLLAAGALLLALGWSHGPLRIQVRPGR